MNNINFKFKDEEFREQFKGYWVSLKKSMLSNSLLENYLLSLYKKERSKRDICFIAFHKDKKTNEYKIMNFKSYDKFKGYGKILFTFFMEKFGNEHITLSISPAFDNKDFNGDLDKSFNFLKRFYENFGFQLIGKATNMSNR